MTEHHFETPRPVSLYVETGKGAVHVLATDTTESLVEISGRDAAGVSVTQDGDEISVVAPRIRTGFLSGDGALQVTVTVPLASSLHLKTGSADITVAGSVSTTKVKSGSGNLSLADLTGPAVLDTGSGDIAVEVANAELRIKSGSGDIRVGHAESSVAVSTGSGDVELGTTNGPTAVKTGSGDLTVVDSRADVALTTGSGDLVIGTANRGRLTFKGASGNIRVGIPAGVPVWTDVSTVSGEIRSNLVGAGEPKDGQDHVELRAKTVSGDVVLTEV